MNTNNGLNVWRKTWNPISEFQNEYDRLFDNWFTPVVYRSKVDQQFVPTCDIEKAEDHYLLTLEMAGVKKEDIKLEVVENQLIISGERKSEPRIREQAQDDTEYLYKYSERHYGKFQRTFTLPVGLDTGKIEANYQDGILRVMVPKEEAAKPRQIKITNGSVGVGSKFFGKTLGQPKEKEEANSSNDFPKDKVAS
jgi:HSP20 family protein